MHACILHVLSVSLTRGCTREEFLNCSLAQIYKAATRARFKKTTAAIPIPTHMTFTDDVSLGKSTFVSDSGEYSSWYRSVNDESKSKGQTLWKFTKIFENFHKKSKIILTKIKYAFLTVTYSSITSVEQSAKIVWMILYHLIKLLTAKFLLVLWSVWSFFSGRFQPSPNICFDSTHWYNAQ